MVRQMITCKTCGSDMEPGRGGLPKLYCSPKCRQQGLYANRKDKMKVYYQQNREKRLAYQNDYNKAYWHRPLNDRAKAIIYLFEHTAEPKLSKFADWLLTKAGTSTTYARTINQWKVDDWIADHTTLAG